ncbi:MAG: hypothetical protein GEV09_15555 [Pseudonocardiaceae bacterium]|nr:hypothetical protein [Pseudonocardiaceae bacterium]
MLNRRAREEAEAQRFALYELLVVVRNRLTAATRQGAEDGLMVLSDALSELLTEARDLEPSLDGARSSDEVLRAPEPVRQAWRQMLELGERYISIRTEAQRLYRGALDLTESQRLLRNHLFDGEASPEDTLLGILDSDTEPVVYSIAELKERAAEREAQARGPVKQRFVTREEWPQHAHTGQARGVRSGQVVNLAAESFENNRSAG